MKKIIKKVLKRLRIFIGFLLLLIVIAGLGFRLFSKPHKPIGKLIDIGNTKLHIHATGKQSNKPTLVIENGGGVPSEHYYWLSKELKDSMRVVRYDRDGIGYSELSNSPRTPETIARELKTLLEKAGEKPPYILAGHSMGGLYIRVFAELYPELVTALIFIDATHPDQVTRLHAPSKSSFKFKTVLGLYNILAVLGDLGIVGLYDHFFGPLLAAEGLPNEINNRMSDFLINGKLISAYRNELKEYHTSLERASAVNHFKSLPIRIFTAIKMNKEVYRKNGIDPDELLNKRIHMHNEYTNLSTNATQILINGNHNTIYSKKENATIICNEILQLLK
ncbi:alpha/beta fold hydrolase [Tenacibaculum amylolyticum]|uniref:alpha/beta fold hydrolase n=1 Tax=Tenacibaculum amylolyticum TaxID=104269 RepID=UPI003895CB97